MNARHELTSFYDSGSGQTLIRAHVWTHNGYSSKTFNFRQDAVGWVMSKVGE